MPDDITLKAEAYIDSCIASMDRPVSAAVRAGAIAKIEEHTRKLAKHLGS